MVQRTFLKQSATSSSWCNATTSIEVPVTSQEKGSDMSTYIVEYTTNGMKTETMLVSAEDYTKAYLSVCYLLPLTAMITSVFKV